MFDLTQQISRSHFTHASPAKPTNRKRASALTEPLDPPKVTRNIPLISPLTDKEPSLNDPCSSAGSSPPVDRAAQFTDTVMVTVSPAIMQTVNKLVDVAKEDGICVRPRIKLDINKATHDVLHISDIPIDMKVEDLSAIVNSFGSILIFDWQRGHTCEVVYKDVEAAREAQRKLNGWNVKRGTLSAVLRARPTTAQLFVGDLIPSITEQMLEKAFEKLVGSTVKATLKRDTNTFSPIGYGFLRFENESAASTALLRGHRMRVGSATIRVGRAERNCYLYITDLSPEVALDDITTKFEKYGELVEEDTTLVRRAHVSVRFNNPRTAEIAKMLLDNTALKGNVAVAYGSEDARQNGKIVVMFPSFATKPPQSLRDLVLATFSKYGSCKVDVPYSRSGYWKRCAMVDFLGESTAVELACIDAMQNVTHVSQYRVMCNWARHILPNRPPRTARTSFNQKTHPISLSSGPKVSNNLAFTTPVREAGSATPHVSFGSVMVCPSPHWNNTFSPLVQVPNTSPAMCREINLFSHPITSLSSSDENDAGRVDKTHVTVTHAPSTNPNSHNSEPSESDHPKTSASDSQVRNTYASVASEERAATSGAKENDTTETDFNRYSIVYLPRHLAGYMHERSEIPENWFIFPQMSSVPPTFLAGQHQVHPGHW